MHRLIVLCLAGLILAAPVRTGDEKDKKNDKLFKVEGKLSKSDPLDRIRTRNPHKVHEYKMKSGSVYLITLVSKDRALDNYLRIESSKGKNLAEDDDSGGGQNARLIFKAPATDTYRIIATAYSGLGDYTLTVRQVSRKELRGELGLAFSQSLRSQYEARYRGGDRKADYLLKDAVTVLNQVVQIRPELAGQAKEVAFALANLTTGRPAMEIEGEDLDGKKFKLSDYRGKVVVLDFWGNW